MKNLVKRIAGKSTLALVTTVLGWAIFGLLFWKAPELLDQFQDYCSDFTVGVARRLGNIFGWGSQTKILVKSFNLGNMLMITVITFLPRAVLWLFGEMHRLSAPAPKKFKHVNM